MRLADVLQASSEIFSRQARRLLKWLAEVHFPAIIKCKHRALYRGTKYLIIFQSRALDDPMDRRRVVASPVQFSSTTSFEDRNIHYVDFE